MNISNKKKIFNKVSKLEDEIKEISVLIDNLEIEIIKKNTDNNKIIELYKIMMENLVLEHHETCKKIFG